jgi:hypothetical protein
MLIQVIAALPWLLTAALNWEEVKASLSRPATVLGVVGTIIGLGLLEGLGLGFLDPETLETVGKLYGALLHLQLAADLFVFVFLILLVVWPKAGAVGLAAFREGLRQPMFWLLTGAAFLAMVLFPFIPYFTFGEDLVMVKEMGYDMIMLAAVVFGVLGASMSISEEIEGRTAITLISKPVSRRQFLLGKYVGILLAGLVMMLLLGWFFNWMVLYKHWFDRMDPVPTPAIVTDTVASLPVSDEAHAFLRGTGLWIVDTVENMPGLILGFCQVMVLLAVAVALATRLPMVVNLVVCLMIYFLGHLSPVLSEIARNRLEVNPGAAGNQMLSFMATLFYNILPGMEFFSVGPALVTDSPPPMGPFYVYVGMVTFYGVLYTLILLLVGLVLFEDRDLA